MDTTTADPLVGRTLDGRYRIESRIARGGMATVYLALDVRLDRTVALKVMHRSLAEDPAFVRRFIGEAKSVASLSHPNVVHVFDQGTDGDVVYLSMEYVPGRTLRDILNERGRLPAREALEILIPVLAALGAAHQAGMVHRDVKPENVLMTADGRVKVVDFGLARAIEATNQTRTGMMIGTIGYMSPEQVTTGRADVRTDVYAAGIMLFELLTGQPPYEGETPMSVAYRHVHDTVPAPSSLNPEVPPVVDALVAHATAREPDARPADATAMLVEAVEVHRQLPRLTAPGAPHTGARYSLPGTGPHASSVPPAPSGPHAPSGPLPAPTAQLPSGAHASPAAGHLPGPRTGPHSGAQPTGPARGGYGPQPASQPGGYGAQPGSQPGGYGTQPGVAGAPGMTVAMPQVPPGGAAVPNPTMIQPRAETPADRPAGRRRGFRPSWIIVALAVVMVAAIGLTGWYVSRPQYVTVPADLVGRPVSLVEAKLASGGLKVRVAQGRHDDKTDEGLVLSLDPVGGQEVEAGTTVTLVPSLGPKLVVVPKVAGMSADDARAAIAKAGLAVGTVRRLANPDVPRNTVIRTSPLVGEKLKEGAKVSIYVSAGLTMPDVAKMPKDQAAAFLQEQGFQVQVNEVDDDAEPCTVIAQSPKANAEVDRGAVAMITVARCQSDFWDWWKGDNEARDGEEHQLVPAVMGKNVNDARQELQQLGWKVRVLKLGKGSGVVRFQRPLPNSERPPGSEVILWH
ncbi:Stk1 family PASTA domain-containing Ser/Thr kinase [Nonomuraea roseoviolacea]|uniref:non-specific serine/threonine protein kinase n=1 Tax=Nonomuraea roseoviolacea subsp. carminata TaxID=160689 RepID=A0ABT1JRL4_9ACTN|nr:PASTA domain-containing protein [Nonomuraea roseoviolacea]MCP2344383.1 serine/threonine-protein kinase [Nonomuraea roseoviolacea subsp. carminata]